MAKHERYKKLETIGLKDNGYYYWNGINYSTLNFKITAKPIINTPLPNILWVILTGDARYYL